MTLLILGLLVFLGIHTVRMVAPDWRLARIAAMGEGRWKGVYSLVSLAGLVLIIFGWRAAPHIELYTTPFWMAHLAILLMALALISLMVSNLPAGKLKPALKHPMLLAVKLWAFAHLLVNGDLASVLLFGSFLAWAVWNRIAVKRRGGAVAKPGPVTNDIIAVVSGLAIWAILIWKAHVWIAGVPIPLA